MDNLKIFFIHLTILIVLIYMLFIPGTHWIFYVFAVGALYPIAKYGIKIAQSLTECEKRKSQSKE